MINRKENVLSVFKSFHIVVQTGSNEITYCKVGKDGKIRYEKDLKVTLEGRVLQCYDDMQFGMGLILLTDTGAKQPMQKQVDNNVFCAHALKYKENLATSIIILKEGKVYDTLVTSADTASVAYDSEVHLYQSSETLFGVNKLGEKV